MAKETRIDHRESVGAGKAGHDEWGVLTEPWYNSQGGDKWRFAFCRWMAVVRGR
jgi:hypothetical protein